MAGLVLSNLFLLLHRANRKAASKSPTAPAMPTESPMTCLVPNPSSGPPEAPAAGSLPEGSGVGVKRDDDVVVSRSVEVEVALVLVESVELVGATMSVVGRGVDDVDLLVGLVISVASGGANTTPPVVPVTTNVPSRAVCVALTAPVCLEHIKYALSMLPAKGQSSSTPLLNKILTS